MLHQLPPRHPNSQVSPDKKIPRHLHDSKYQDDTDNHYERDEDMHTGYIASRPLTDNTRIQVNGMTLDEIKLDPGRPAVSPR
jgi:hypothetical protein